MSTSAFGPNENVPAEDPGGAYYLVGESDARTRFIADLRSFADFLAANPEVPAPRHGCSILVVASGTDEEKVSQVDAVSRLLNEQPTDARGAGGNYEVARAFGSIEYLFFGVPADQRARHRAWLSYAGAVEPDEPTAPAHLAAEAFPSPEASAASPPASAPDGDQPTEMAPRAGRGKTP